MDAFTQLAYILELTSILFSIEEARIQLHSICLSTLKSTNGNNKFGFWEIGKFLLDLFAVKNEITWLPSTYIALDSTKLQVMLVFCASNTLDSKLLKGS
jgi:hypothetical protein